MKKISYRVLPTILMCSAMVLTACSDEDNGVAVGLMATGATTRCNCVVSTSSVTTTPISV